MKHRSCVMQDVPNALGKLLQHFEFASVGEDGDEGQDGG